MTDRTCHSNTCEQEAIIRCFWPGSSPPPEYCMDCALRMQGVAQAMGLVVHTEPLQSLNIQERGNGMPSN